MTFDNRSAGENRQLTIDQIYNLGEASQESSENEQLLPEMFNEQEMALYEAITQRQTCFLVLDRLRENSALRFPFDERLSLRSQNIINNYLPEICKKLQNENARPVLIQIRNPQTRSLNTNLPKDFLLALNDEYYEYMQENHPEEQIFFPTKRNICFIPQNYLLIRLLKDLPDAFEFPLYKNILIPRTNNIKKLGAYEMESLYYQLECQLNLQNNNN